MYNFEYEIQLNDVGRPYVKPINGTDKELDLTEHKFMGVEVTRTILYNTVRSFENKNLKETEEYKRLLIVLLEMEKISDIFAQTILDQQQILRDSYSLLKNNEYHLRVDTIDELHNLNYNGIIYGESLFKREIGLRVVVSKENKIFELKEGIDNIHWTDVTN